jgi:hypothetical protein
MVVGGTKAGIYVGMVFVEWKFTELFCKHFNYQHIKKIKRRFEIFVIAFQFQKIVLQ